MEISNTSKDSRLKHIAYRHMFEEGKIVAIGDSFIENDLIDSSDAGAEITENDNFNGQNFVTVSDGQYLILSRCTGELS